MDKKEILAFITENPTSFLGTAEGNAGRVRGMDTFRADENGIIFYTNKNKEVCKQALSCAGVEACFFAKGTQVRVRGKMELVEDMALKKEVLEKKPFIKPLYEKSLEPLALLRLKGKATTWSMQNMTAPTTWIDL
jgi:uncharacterized pyridoxamine 5'-phosphate oxidase family protein